MQKTIGVIGGDRRQAELTHILRKEGHDVATCGLGRWLAGDRLLEEAVKREILILPLPLCKDTDCLNFEGQFLAMDDFFHMLRPEQVLLAGKVERRQYEQAERLGLVLQDYLQNEVFGVYNASATAEAAIRVAMERLEQSLLGMQALILGFGRIGKLLAPRLQALGCRVTIAARKAVDRAWIQAYGYRSLDIENLSGKLSGFDLVLNTVPAPVMDEGLCAELEETCLVIELASSPGVTPGQNINLVAAPGLPGKYMPRTAARAVREAIRSTIL